MLKRFLFPVVLVLFAVAQAGAVLAAGDGEGGSFDFGHDVYGSGLDVVQRIPGVDDFFAFGGRAVVAADISGSAHMFARSVGVEAPVGENVYAVGRDISIAAPVTGDVTAMGDSIAIKAAVGGDLRAMGNSVSLDAPVGDGALLAGETLTVNGVVEGDLGLASQNVHFGPRASVGGTLHIFADKPEAIEVPASVAPPERIVVHPASDFDTLQNGPGMGRPASFWHGLRGLVGGILVGGLLALIMATLAPGPVADMRQRALARPVRALWVGFLALSAAFGSVVVLALSGIGVIVVPVSIVLGALLSGLGYLMGIYMFGIALMRLAGRGVPETTGARATAAFAGAGAAAVVSLIPFAGWLFLLGLALFGAGALVSRWVGFGRDAPAGA